MHLAKRAGLPDYKLICDHNSIQNLGTYWAKLATKKIHKIQAATLVTLKENIHFR
jgi:hypothetical protein